MRDSLISYAGHVQTLQKRLDVTLGNGKRTKRAANKLPVTFTDAEKAAFDQVKDCLASAAMLAHPSPDGVLSVFTDASDTAWSVIVTDVEKWQSDKPVADQTHRLLHCLTGTFSGSQENWSVIEKEAFAIVAACDKLPHLLLRPAGFRLFCDHRNLIHAFAPDTTVKEHIRGKLLRWAMRLGEFRYEIHHIAGADNVWADMVSRWARMPATTSLRRVTTRDQQQQDRLLLRPLDDDDFVWPNLDTIAAAQRKFGDKAELSRLEEGDDGVRRTDSRLWIPAEATNLLRRLYIIAHCGPQGHRGRDAMLAHIGRIFYVPHLRQCVDRFLASCLLCHHVKGGKVVPRPWSETYRCNERNQALHWDFLYLGESFGDMQYLLVLKDDASHYCELVKCETPTSTVAADAIMDWHSRFGIPRDWISDQGSHFKNEVVNELCTRLKCQQIFSPTYSSWINGSVERVNRDILQVLRVLILDYKLNHRDWPRLIPIVQASLNHTAVPSPAGKTPGELFTGLEPPSPLQSVFLGPDVSPSVQPARTSAEIESSLAQLRARVRDMHRAVTDARLKQTLLNKKRERGDNMVNFDVGDYVLRSRVDEKRQNKLLVTWVGPYAVTAAHAHNVFTVKQLVTGEELDVHASRLKFFADKDLEVTEELLEHVAAQGIILRVRDLIGPTLVVPPMLVRHRWNDESRSYEILVGWHGLEAIEDSWESLTAMFNEVSTLVQAYVAAAKDSKLERHLEALEASTKRR
ncbi:hypothetical protein PF003_g12674 [Phytophthora fragariae]|nr:hypothetical protein PF003_g12674 [Phytophthora fragariae]